MARPVSRIDLDEVAVDVVFKNIKHVHLAVTPPEGAVRISAPARSNLDTLRAFAISRLDWIRRHQRRMREQQRETPRQYIDRESHYLWGRRYLLQVYESPRQASVGLEHHRIVLRLPQGTTHDRRGEVLEAWYRRQLRDAVPSVIAKWEPLLAVKVERFYVQRMKTKWGSCNHRAGTIRLNTDLARKPPHCLEYVLVHEMAHLIEPSHNARFTSLLDRLIPEWRHRRDELNQLPLNDGSWEARQLGN